MIRRYFMGMALLALTVICLPSGFAVADEESGESEDERRTPDVVYVGTPKDVLTKMLEMAEVTKEDTVYDLGCGDGRIVVAAAKKYGCKAVGYDLNPVRVGESLRNAKRNGVEDLVRIERKDIYKVDLSPATVLTLYLLPEMNTKLLPQIEKMKPGTRIVAHDYGIEGYTPDETVTMTSKIDAVEHYIYLWKVPLVKDPEADPEADSEE